MVRCRSCAELSSLLLLLTATQLRAQEARLTKVLQIGGDVTDSASAFERIGGVAISHDRIFVLDVGLRRVSIFDLQGSFLRSFGRDGRGPGEFTVPVAIRVDTIVRVFDAAQNRESIFSRSGDHIATRQLPFVAGLPLGRMFQVRGGRYIGETVSRFSSVSAEADPHNTIVMFQSPAGPVDTLGHFRVGGTIVVPIKGSDSWAGRSVPMGNAGTWSLMGDSVAVIADGYEGTVSWFKLGTNVQLVKKREIGLRSRPVTRSDIEQLDRDFRREGRRLPTLDGALLPPKWSVATAVVVSSNGSVWVRNGVAGIEGRTWTVLRDAGAERRLLPEGFQLKAVQDGLLYGIQADALGSQMIVVYRAFN
jgi:hypothetical protein